MDLATGTIRVAATPGFLLGIDIAWARWLPDRAHLIAGAATGPGYLVDSATLAAEPLRLAAATAGGHGQPHTLDINYTTAVMPPRS